MSIKGESNMLKREDILKILKKYGFYSLNRAPYLYQDKEHLGIYFIWPNKQYGNLERVIFFHDEESVEEELFKYWWFLENKEKYNIEIEFDNYEILAPKIIYKYKNSVISKKEMQNFDLFLESYVDPKEEITRKQLVRSADILISILKEKFKIQNETYQKVSEYAATCLELNNTYLKKLSEYKKDKKEIHEEYEVLVDNLDDNEDLVNRLYDELGSIHNFDELRDFINNLAHYIKEIDMSEAHFQNVYLLNRYPYEIEDIKKKITVLENHLSLRKKLFKGKKDALEELKKIDLSSECTKMVNINVYITKEKKKITEKYQNEKTVSEEFLGDYLIEFLNMEIPIPPSIDVKGAIEEIDKKRLILTVRKYYDKLNAQEKSACFVASSFLRESLSVLVSLDAVNELNTNETISKIILNQKIDLFNEAYQILDYYANTKIRVKYFSILKMNSFETFMASLVEVLRILKNIEMKIDKSFFAYFTSMDKEVIPLYLKNVFYYSHKTSYIGIVSPNTPFYYSPVEIVSKIDILDNTELMERDNDAIFLLKEKIKTERKKDKLVVVKYEKETVLNKKDYVVVSSMKEKSRCNYYENMIYNKFEE